MKDERFRDWRVQSELLHSHNNLKFTRPTPRTVSPAGEPRRHEGGADWLAALVALAIMLATTLSLLADKYGDTIKGMLP